MTNEKTLSPLEQQLRAARLERQAAERAALAEQQASAGSGDGTV